MEDTLDEHLLGDFEEKNFEFYKSFLHQDDATPYVELLEENGVPYKLEGAETIITEAIVGSPMFPKIILKILPRDFKRVNLIIEKEILRNAPDLEAHYLNDSTDHELLDILKKQDQYTIEEIIITKELLKSRGIPIDVITLEKMKQKHLEEIHKGRSGSKGWMVFYMMMIILGSILGSPLAIIAGVGMGWFYWKDKSIDIDGNKYFTFDPPTQNFGKLMFYFAIVIAVIGFLLMMLFRASIFEYSLTPSPF